jgi:hypothetical protein
MHVKSILHEFGKCKIDYYLAAKIDFTRKPILAAPELLQRTPFCHVLVGAICHVLVFVMFWLAPNLSLPELVPYCRVEFLSLA